MVIDHMSQGYSFESFAAIVNVSKDTLYEWAKQHKEFSDAGDQARSKARLFWEQKGIEGMNGKIRNFNSGVWQFWMKNRFKWHDNLQVSQDIKAEVKQDNTDLVNLALNVFQTAALKKDPNAK